MRSFLRAKKREFAAAGEAPPVELGAEPLQGRRVRPEVPRTLQQLVSSMRERTLFVLALAPQPLTPVVPAASRPAPLTPSGGSFGGPHALKRSASGGGAGLASSHSIGSTGSGDHRDAVSMMHAKWAALLPAATLLPLLTRYASSGAPEDADGGGSVPPAPPTPRWGVGQLARQRSLQRAISEAPDGLPVGGGAAGDDALADEYSALAEEELAEGAGADELGALLLVITGAALPRVL